MTIEQKQNTKKQLELLMAKLEQLGIEYEYITPMRLVFGNQIGECVVFPSQTYDDKLVLFHQVKERCETADEVLKACGIVEE